MNQNKSKSGHTVIECEQVLPVEMAEGMGFEPMDGYPSPVFKSADAR